MISNQNYENYAHSDDIIKKLLVLHGHIYSERKDMCPIQIECIDLLTDSYRPYFSLNRYGSVYSESSTDSSLIPHIDILNYRDENHINILTDKFNANKLDGMEIYDLGHRTYVCIVENEITNRIGFYCKLLLMLLNEEPSTKFKDINVKYKQILENEEITEENINNLMREFNDIFIDYKYLENTLKDSIIRVQSSVDGNSVFEVYHKYLHYLNLLKDKIIETEDKVTEFKNKILAINTDIKLDINTFIDIVKRIKDITINDVTYEGIIFNIDTFLRVYSKQDLLILLKNTGSYFYQSLRDVIDTRVLQNVFKAIFFDKKYKIRFTNLIRLNWNDLYVTNYTQSDRIPNTLFNPHITYYNCFSDVKNECRKALSDGDFNKFFGQLLSGVQSITVTDSVVMSRFLHDIKYNYKTNKVFYDVENKCYVTFNDIAEKYKDLPEPDWDNLEVNDVAKETR